MAQVNFIENNYKGTLIFSVENIFNGSFEKEIYFTSFEEMNSLLGKYFEKKYDDLFELDGYSEIHFTGIAFSGKQETERFSIDFTEGWNRATIIFDENKFAKINNDKMKRIAAILAE